MLTHLEWISVPIPMLYSWNNMIKIVTMWHVPSAREVIENENINPRESTYFKVLDDFLKKKGIIWGYIRSEEHIIKRFNEFKDSIIDIRDNEYDRDRMKINWKNDVAFGPITGYVRNDGTIGLWDGHHRVSILYALGKESVELYVGKREPDWLAFKQSVYDISNVQAQYHPIQHPDFADWKWWRPCDKRVDIILQNIKGDVRGLDLGTCMGYFCQRLTAKGYQMLGVEIDKKYWTLANNLSSLYDIEIPIVNEDAVEFVRTTNEDFDFVIFLSLFHHFHKSNPENGKKSLKIISKITRKMFFDMGQDDTEPKRWPGGLKSTEIPDYIINHSEFIKSTELFTDFQGRKMWMFERL